ncbi:StAR- lipid transfer protein 3 [Phlyctochytrium planicorne]|nr:StAR- lipid transfer protein 3 [Phlyctochytrium planicorne]
MTIDISTLAEKTYQEFLDILYLEGNWNFSHKKVAECFNGVNVKSRTVDWSPAMQWMGESEIEASAERVFSTLTDYEGRPKWDSVMAAYKNLRIITEDVHLSYTLTQPIFVISARDYIDLRVVRENPTSYVMAWRSPEDGTFPDEWMAPPSDIELEKLKPVRGFNHVGGIRVSKIEGEPNKCKVEYMVHSEIKGSMPVWIVNKGTGGAIDGIFASLKKAVSA